MASRRRQVSLLPTPSLVGQRSANSCARCFRKNLRPIWVAARTLKLRLRGAVRHVLKPIGARTAACGLAQPPTGVLQPPTGALSRLRACFSRLRACFAAYGRAPPPAGARVNFHSLSLSLSLSPLLVSLWFCSSADRYCMFAGPSLSLSLSLLSLALSVLSFSLVLYLTVRDCFMFLCVILTLFMFFLSLFFFGCVPKV